MADEWMSLDSAPEDESVLIATDGGWVGEATFLWGEAFFGDYLVQNWSWASGFAVKHEVLAWMPLPSFADPRAWKEAHPKVATKPIPA